MSPQRSTHVRGQTTTRRTARGSSHTTPLSSQDSTPADSRMASPALPTAQTGIFRPTTPPNVNEDEDITLPVIVSPIKKRVSPVAPTIKKLSDFEVWDMNDNEIIGMFCADYLNYYK
jgi:hypothetical protein